MSESAESRKLGYMPSPPEQVGDGHPLALLGAAPVVLPDEASVEMPPVLDQTDEDCTANAVAIAIQAEMGKRPDGTWHPLASRRFLYAFSREIANISLAQNAGSFIWSTMQVGRAIGFCPESVLPYSYPVDQPPTQDADQAAADQTIGVDGVFRLASVDDALLIDVLRSIAAGSTVPGGFMIDNAFMRATAGTVWPGPTGQIVGGHAVTACAFRGVRNGGDIDHAEVLYRSSWGDDFGDRGGIWIAARGVKLALDSWRVTVKVPAGYSSEEVTQS